MMAVPPAVLEMLDLRPGAQVGLTVERGRLVMETRPRPRYTLNELLAQCNPRARRRKDGGQWLADKATGRELI